MLNALTIDVEEYFHPAEVQHATSIEEWPSLPSRVEAQTDRVLELLDRHSVTQESLWALEILVECGFQCDSSIVPINHDRYGIPGFKRHSQVLQTPSGPIMEIPAATAQLFRKTIIPVGGGAYLRLLPYRY